MDSMSRPAVASAQVDTSMKSQSLFSVAIQMLSPWLPIWHPVGEIISQKHHIAIDDCTGVL
jgi:hypothetical protein